MVFYAAKAGMDEEELEAEKGKFVWLWAPKNRYWIPWSTKSMRLQLLFLGTLAIVFLLTSLLHPLLEVKENDWSHELMSVPLVPSPTLQPLPLSLASLNSTILALAKVEPLEALEKRRIGKILAELQDDLGLAQQDLNLQYHRKRDGLYSEERKSRPEPWEVELSRSLYRHHWGPFRQLLRDWVERKHYSPQIMGQLLEQVKVSLDLHEKQGGAGKRAGTRRYKTCAVVGNSGVVLNSVKGAFIDSHEMVIRINQAEVKGYENFVGTKTTLSFMNSNVYHDCAKRAGCNCHYASFDEKVAILTYMCTAIHLMDTARCTSLRSAPLLVTDPRFDILCFRIVKWYSLTLFASRTGGSVEGWATRYGGEYFHYSSGFQAVMLALGLCEQVDLLGFGKVEGLRHHYHNSQKAELALHDYEAEYLFYNDIMLNRSSSIPFLQNAGVPMPPLRIFL